MVSGREKLFIICVAAAASLIVVTEIYRRRRQRTAVVRLCCSEFEEKPQSRFKRVLADNSYSPFKHYKREGKEREISLKMHPYEEEISSLLANPPSVVEFVSSHDSVMGDSYIWIHTEDQLQFLASSLSNEHIFSVDTEQHSFRSFLGFTALMQISTQNDDFLLDTIALHDAMSILRPVFADPSICKVFHGADNDVLWLQRDFHIYVVNLFDTAKACEVLSKPQKSLAYLLETYCGVSTDKTFQREDWRIRPLSAEMIKYARTDAHYLLFIADCLASELRKENEACPDDKFSLFFEAIRRSNMVCMQLYAKDIESTPGASSAASIYSRNSHVQENISMMNFETKELIWKLCAWRDLMARIHDESLRYVLSDQAIPCLAAEAPKTPRGVLSVIQHADLCTDSSNGPRSPPSVSHIVSAHVDELCFLLHTADSNSDDIFKRYLQKRLDPAVCCPISIYNYALLSEFSIKRNSTLFSKQNRRKLNAPVGKKASRELFVQKFSCKAPVYHNCRIYANDGRLLCYCDRRKLEWYVRRNLAKVVEDDPPAIILLFEPKGRPEDEDNDFYIQSKKNICVGCGEKNHYLRYRIIPSCYRVHFPEHLKSHRSHDIVLLCVDCHEIAHTAAEKYKRQVASEFGIPLFVRKIVDLGESKDINTSRSVSDVEESGVSPLQLRTAAMALLRHGSTMPSKRHDELMQIVQAYFGGREISSEDLEMALLVGMSPHEIRRLEKKKGLNFRRYKDNNFHLVSNMQTKVCDNNSINIIHNSKGSSEDGDTSDIDIGQANTSMDDVDVSLLPNEDNLATDSIETLTEENNFILNHDNGYGNPSDETSGHDQSSGSVQVISSKSAKKLSLLGHGPHGRQVVEHLLKNYGEDGICEFCQRWRQVFVEAVHPRFLPSGWDVMHSGRRDFGDYSVYNPAKRTQKVE